VTKTEEVKEDAGEKKIEVIVADKLVEEAVGRINELVKETLFDGAKKIGAYVFETFYDNDVERVRSHNPKKDASFRKLAERCDIDLLVSKTFLGNAVGVAVMCKLLPSGEQAYKQLPHSHQAALLPLREPKQVEAMAERAVKQELPVRKLRLLVQQKVEANKDENLGRPPTPIILKTLNRTLKLFTPEGGRKSFTKAQVKELSADDAKKAREAAEKLMKSLENLLEELPGK
jgi:hypothetical protein